MTGAETGVTAKKALLSVDGLARKFGDLTVLSGLTLQVAPGERRALLGPNGAGKTTFFNVLTGHLLPTAGTIAFGERSIGGLTPPQVARLGISRSFQKNNLFAGLTVRENLRLAAAAGHGATFHPFAGMARMSAAKAKAEEVAKSVGLSDRLDAVVGRLSYGEERQLEIGVALATSPTLLLLDEPTSGMSPQETERMTRMLEGLPRDITVLLIEHDMDVVATLCDEVAVMHHGEVIASGTFEHVKKDPRVYEVYLGAKE